MEGGNIVGCSAGKSGGGGVKVTNDGDFKMSGGTISGCIARNGGGLRNEGTATLSDTAKIEAAALPAPRAMITAVGFAVIAI